MSTRVTTVDLGVGDTGLPNGCGCGCGCGGCGGCGTSGTGTERPRWFAGQLVGPGDLETLQQWVIGRARRHNRMLHGWGVACGLTVTATPSTAGGERVPWSVTVGAGYALTGCGDEVCVPSDVRVDIRSPRPDPADVCAPPVDPWCAPVRERRDPERTYYLAIRYAEQPTRPVRTSACGCGCDDDPCEYSRVGETYALAVLDALPECYLEAQRESERPSTRLPGESGGLLASASALLEDRKEAVGCSPEIRRLGTRPCPDCCSPWVVLADLRVDARGTVAVDPLTHRRFLASFGRYGFTCAPRPDSAPTVTIIRPESGATFPAGHVTPLELEGTASDPEDGMLTGESVQWFDSHHDAQQELLGQGTTLSTTLSWDKEDQPTRVTLHTILVEATDSDGNVATDSITVSVGEPRPLPPPSRITAHAPANGAMLPGSWNTHRQIEISFDRDMDAASLSQPDPWLRVFAVFPQDIFHSDTSIVRLEVEPVGSGDRKVAQYDLRPSDESHAFLYLVQVRAASQIKDAGDPAQILDADFAGTKLPASILNELWSLDVGARTVRPDGWFVAADWTTQNSLPSGDGHEGGNFHLLFNVEVPINVR